MDLLANVEKFSLTCGLRKAPSNLLMKFDVERAL